MAVGSIIPDDVAEKEWMKRLSCDGRWIPFDDGHVPETWQQQEQTPLPPSDDSETASSCRNSTERSNRVDRVLALYPEYFEKRMPALHVFDNVVPGDIVQALYEITVQDTQPWGTYVSMQQIHQHWKQRQQESSQLSSNMGTNTLNLRQDWPQHLETPTTHDKRDYLALLAVDAFLRAALASHTASQSYTKDGTRAVPVSSSNTATNIKSDGKTSQSQRNSFWTGSDLDRLHGVAVWSLGASVGSQVPYHLDYAEQVRYETNRIVPPILAGTLQCTDASIDGGMYCAHVNGLDHYMRFGYKGMKETKKNILDTLNDDAGWIRVPYRRNRLIVQSGHLPHLSTPIQAIDNVDDDNGDVVKEKKKRVIVGFNAFLPDVGPLVQRAPEHSQVFRRKVALQRWLLSQTSNMRDSSKDAVMGETSASDDFCKAKTTGSGGLSLQSIRANPSLAKLLVLAKRQKAKDDFAKQRLDLNCAIRQHLATAKINSSGIKNTQGSVLVRDLMQQFGRTDGQYPSPVDVQVHLFQGTKRGQYKLTGKSGQDNVDMRATEDHEDCFLSSNALVQLV
ncbi:hypothetical protein ACA910_022116 [Epithemia clementina (nom. ined.)]